MAVNAFSKQVPFRRREIHVVAQTIFSTEKECLDEGVKLFGGAINRTILKPNNFKPVLIHTRNRAVFIIRPFSFQFKLKNLCAWFHIHQTLFINGLQKAS